MNYLNSSDKLTSNCDNVAVMTDVYTKLSGRYSGVNIRGRVVGGGQEKKKKNYEFGSMSFEMGPIVNIQQTVTVKQVD